MAVAVDNKGLKISLVDGSDYEVQHSGVFFVCGICADEYSEEPEFGYCDNTLECACDDGESLIVLPGFVRQ